MIGHQTKFSDMVKGKQHDQTFDQTMEFVLAAGQSPLLLLLVSHRKLPVKAIPAHGLCATHCPEQAHLKGAVQLHLPLPKHC